MNSQENCVHFCSRSVGGCAAVVLAHRISASCKVEQFNLSDSNVWHSLGVLEEAAADPCFLRIQVHCFVDLLVMCAINGVGALCC